MIAVNTPDQAEINAHLCSELKRLREENILLKGELIGTLEGILLYEDKLPLSVVELKKQRLQELKAK
jgi:hypothetical protein